MRQLTSFFASAMILVFLRSVEAQDCTISKSFRIKHPQVFAGVLKDPNGVTLPGFGLELLSGTKIIQDARTTKEGNFEFGKIAPGKYRLHIVSAGDPFCAPPVQCGTRGCSSGWQVRLNPKKSITIN